MKPLIFRQGDVLLRSVGELPRDVVEVKRDEIGRVVLAHGERTGHAHAIRDKHVTGFKRESSEYPAMAGFYDFILVGGSGAKLSHEHVNGVKAEHDAIKMPPGLYEVAQQCEYSPAALQRVFD